MDRRPAVGGSRFLDRAELTALALVGVALGAGVLCAALLSRHEPQSAAVTAWLIGHALVAFALRARPTLGPRQNPAFWAWSAAATAAGVILAATPAGHAFGLAELSAAGWGHVAVGLAVMAALAVAGRAGLRLGRRL